MAALLLSVTAALNPSWLLTVDEPVSGWVRGNGAFEGLFTATTALGSLNFAIGVAVVATTTLWRRCRALALAFPIAVLTGIVIDIVLKLAVDRPRPPAPAVGTELGSLPSGHVIQAVVVLGLLPPMVWVWTRRKRLLLAAYALFAVGAPIVAFTRIRLGAHWPSDVVFSFFLGALLLLGAEYVLGSSWVDSHCAGCAFHVPRESTRHGPGIESAEDHSLPQYWREAGSYR